MHNQTAANIDSLSGDKLCLISRQEHGHTGNILGSTQSTDGNLSCQIGLDPFRTHIPLAGVFPDVPVVPEGGKDRAGAEGVDPNTVSGKRQSQTTKNAVRSQETYGRAEQGL